MTLNTDGFFDLQINGYGGVDFQSDALNAEELHRACASVRSEGVSEFLATVITDDVLKMEQRLRRIVEIRERDLLVRQTIAGIHIEGPFISPVDGYRGAHPRDAARPADRDAVQRLLDAAGGLTKIVTLAPEHDPSLQVTRLLAQQNIRVSAGHTNATVEQLNAAIDAGLSMFTHLGNGCPMQMDRNDNIIQRALSLSEKLWLMFIADGAHVSYPALKNYLRAAGFDRCIIVSDAIAPAGLGPGRYTLGRWDLVIGKDLVARAPDGTHLIGSVLSLPLAGRRLVERLGLTPQEAQRLAAHNPRVALGIECDCCECQDRNANSEARGKRVAHARTEAAKVTAQTTQFLSRRSLGGAIPD